MAKKRRRRSRKSKGRGGIGNSIYRLGKFIAGPTAFLDQVSAKDRQVLGNSFTNAPTTQKLKILSNIVTGRVTGINFFGDEYQAPQTLNPAGIFNKWTAAGVLMKAYGIIGKNVNRSMKTSVLPQTSKVGSIGDKVLIGGAVGGFFDDAPMTNSTVMGTMSHTGTRSLSPQPSLQIRRSNFSSGSDSTEVGLS